MFNRYKHKDKSVLFVDTPRGAWQLVRWVELTKPITNLRKLWVSLRALQVTAFYPSYMIIHVSFPNSILETKHSNHPTHAPVKMPPTLHLQPSDKFFLLLS
jgi:hypothetical protein